MSDTTHAAPPRRRSRLAIFAAIVLGLPLLAIALLLAVLNTGPGQSYAAGLAARLTGGSVRLAGLHGRLPDAPRLDRLELHDTKGVWLTATGITLDWSPLRLLSGTAAVRSLAVATLAIERMPAPAAKPSPPGKPFHLPVAVDAPSVAIADLFLGAPVAGATAHLGVQGAAHLRSLSRGTIDLALRRTDQPGSYLLQAALNETDVNARLSVQEPARGLVSSAARLPDLGALSLEATLIGPARAASLRLALAAGPLRVSTDGTLDLNDRAADLALRADAPAMTLAPGLGWQSVAIAARVQGPLARPAASGTIDIAGLTAAGNGIGHITGQIRADTHAAALTARLQDVALAPPNAALLAGGPLDLTASVDLDDPHKPLSYHFEQSIVQGHGTATLAPDLRASLTVAIPTLATLAAARGRDVRGDAGFTLQIARADAATRVDLDAAMAVTGGRDAPPAARGSTRIGATVTLAGADIVLSRLALDGTSLHVSATGARRAGQVTAQWHLASTDLHDLVPALRGAIDATGQLDGTQQDFAASAQLSGMLGTGTLPPAPVSLVLDATGLPHLPAGHIRGSASLAGAPLTLDVAATRAADGTLALTVNRADWVSAAVTGALTLLPGTTLPTGSLALHVGRLADLRPLLNKPIAGSLDATLGLPPAAAARLHLDARNAGLSGTATVARLLLDATLSDPVAHPSVTARLDASGLAAGTIAGNAHLAAAGPLDAMALQLDTALHGLAGADATIAAAATLDARAHTLRLGRLAALWHSETLGLAAPAILTYQPQIAVDRLRLTLSAASAPTATVDLAGRLSPTLALTVVGRDITPALARPFAPDLDAAGTISLDARLAGTPAAPSGTLHLTAAALRMRSGPGRALPPASLTAQATLAGTTAQIDAQLQAGGLAHLALTGRAPLTAGGPLALHADGSLGLALLDPILTAQGRRVRGTATLDATIAGTAAAPLVAGTLHLAQGEVQDYAQGIHITDIDTAIAATGETLRIDRFSGRAGAGSIKVSGTVGLRAPMPVDLHVTADNARPIVSDLVTATLDADLHIAGAAQTSVIASGRVHVRQADIQVPDRLPASVVVLDVHRPGEHAAPVAVAPALSLPLDIVLDAPSRIFVRGHGLDAELGGTLHVGGTVAAPQTSGSIALRTGSFSLAGQTLTFTSGTISFNGARRIDPALDLVASSSNADIVATLTVGGYASAPTIALTSVPDRPQDEILSALLFNQTTASLSPFQLAQIAAALAQVSGVGGGGPDPISRLRKGIGLDRLAIGTSGTGGSATTSVEAGRYVARGVFVGAKQGTTGAETQAEVQIDITKGLKLNTDVGSGPGGNNLGITYQFQY